MAVDVLDRDERALPGRPTRDRPDARARPEGQGGGGLQPGSAPRAAAPARAALGGPNHGGPAGGGGPVGQSGPAEETSTPLAQDESSHKHQQQTIMMVDRFERKRILEVESVPLYDDQGKRVGTLTTFSDLTSIHQTTPEKFVGLLRTSIEPQVLSSLHSLLKQREDNWIFEFVIDFFRF